MAGLSGGFPLIQTVFTYTVSLSVTVPLGGDHLMGGTIIM